MIFCKLVRVLHRENKINWINEILAYEICICCQRNNLFNSMISFIWITTVFMKFRDIESIKISFEPTKSVCLVKRLNNTSRNNTITCEQTENWDIIIQHMTKVTHVKITHYLDDTKKKQIKAAMLAAPSSAFHTISTERDWCAIYNCRRTGCRQLNVYLNQINHFIKNVFQINFYLKSIKFSPCGSMQRFIKFK